MTNMWNPFTMLIAIAFVYFTLGATWGTLFTVLAIPLYLNYRKEMAQIDSDLEKALKKEREKR
jgi:hypothetical protein